MKTWPWFFAAWRRNNLPALAGIPAFLLLAAGILAASPTASVFRIEADTTGHWVSSFRAAADQLKKRPGGSIVFGPGEFRLGGKDTLLLEEVRDANLFGTDSGTHFKALAGQPPPLYFLILRRCSNVGVFALQMNGAPLPSKNYRANSDWHIGILALQSEAIHIHDCRFSGFFTGGVRLNATTRSSVTRCRFDSVDNKAGGDYGAIHLQELEDVLIADNDILSCRFSGISGWKAKRVQIRGNRIRVRPDSPYGMGLYLIGGLEESVLSGNRIEGPRNEGIAIQGKRDQPVTKNLVTGNVLSASFAGIAFNDASGDVGDTRFNQIIGNIISGSPVDSVQHGILLQGGRNSVIADNIIRRCRIGISLQNGTSDNTVSRNTIVRAQAGIVAGGNAFIENNRIDSASQAAILVSHTTRTLVRRNHFGPLAKPVIAGDGVASGAVILEGNTSRDSLKPLPQ